MRILWDEGMCASTGMCESVAPDVFEVGDDGVLVVHDATPPEDRRRNIEEAVYSCPVRALRLED